jgi:hypothetical protein
VKNILNAGLEGEPLPGETPPPPPRRTYQHARPASEFFEVEMCLEHDSAMEALSC